MTHFNIVQQKPKILPIIKRWIRIEKINKISSVGGFEFHNGDFQFASVNSIKI